MVTTPPMHHLFRPRRFLFACLLLSASAVAAPPPEHGVARLDVAVDATSVNLFLEVPLDSLVGFEREPRSDDERKQVEVALAQLRNSVALFGIDPAAACAPRRVTLQSDTLGLGGPPDKGGHADVQGSYEFACKNAGRAGFVEARLFGAFARLRRVEVQAATRRGQLKATLVRPVTRVPLAR
jgi:hypothetical protein